VIALAATIVGVLWFVVDLVLGRPEAHLAAGSALAFFVGLWDVLPVVLARRGVALRD